ncbi:hypothetical protein Kpho02_71540 [Kitasatospora phosalacinea]|uniref:DUF4132 domain-containing protein n=1 Tax=Kitasatospora phosalacinea TaxID=2065 RepID=A0A9W6QDM0_9ACTN|nr:DUF4132 domain-containing protein [Kitasatospora phosalacinea]GLW74857.1 hypothetical protein Kpho02_71540 [Kitasatospora phosalacinea]
MGRSEADEEVFVLPEAWRRALVPRRGGAGRAPGAAVKGAVDKLRARLERERGLVEEVLARPGSDPRAVAAARAYLAGGADPLGAAVVSAVAEGPSTDHRVAADAWVAEHGTAFAAAAVVELLDVDFSWSWGRPAQGLDRPGVRMGRSEHGADRRAAADRVRALLAACAEPLHREAVAALAPLRTSPAREVTAAYLAPAEPGWVDACCRPGVRWNETGWSMLLCSLSSAEQLARLDEVPTLGWQGWPTAVVATVAEGLGGAAAPVLLRSAERPYVPADKQRALFDAVAVLPSDEGFRALAARHAEAVARPALLEAVHRYPLRALRLLVEAEAAGGAPGPDGGVLGPLLAGLVAAHREFARELLPGLPAAQAAVLAPLVERGGRLPEVALADLPVVLADPPWAGPRPAAEVRVVTGPVAPAGCTVHWLPGEREQWATPPADGYDDDGRVEEDWARAAERFGRGESGDFEECAFVLHGPEELVRPLLAGWRAPERLRWDGLEVLRPVAARFGADAVEVLLRAARSEPTLLSSLLLPYLDVEVARCAADWLVRLKSAGATARSWFERHGVAAARLLVPDAVGRAGAARRAAEQGLRLVAAAHGAAAVCGVAAEYGPEAVAAVGLLLSADPLVEALPAKLPVVEGWADPLALPQVPVLGGGAALPVSAARHLVTVLALSRPGEAYPGVAEVVRVCEADGLAEFAWALFERWRLVGMPASGAWALHALGLLGNDTTVRRLAPLVRAWPGEGAHHRAVEGLEVLAAIGTDTALLHLHRIAQRVPFKALKARAGERIAEVASGLGLTGEQLADRLVPDFGLDGAGTAVVDYGARRFTVGFDEQLRPFVVDGEGRRRKELPVPGAGDDAESAAAGRRRYAELKKEVRPTAADQVRRLEAAMVAQRSWSVAEFTALLVAHPLLGHLVRRLVWLAQEDGGPVTAFRVAEDATFADVADGAFALPEGARVRVAHPVLLGAELAAWVELFADYGVLQPFRQLERPVHALTEQERAGHRLARFEGGPVVPTVRFLALERRGWERGSPQDNGVSRWLSRRVGPAGHLVVVPERGIAAGTRDVHPEQSVREVWLGPRPGEYRVAGAGAATLAALDPVTASELLADLTELTVP